jgi:hypothetical protein
MPRDNRAAMRLLRRVVPTQDRKRPQNTYPKLDASDEAATRKRSNQRSRWSRAGLWAWLDLNQRPHPYQVSRAQRCADGRFPRSRTSVRGEGMRSNSAVDWRPPCGLRANDHDDMPIAVHGCTLCCTYDSGSRAPRRRRTGCPWLVVLWFRCCRGRGVGRSSPSGPCRPRC